MIDSGIYGLNVIENLYKSHEKFFPCLSKQEDSNYFLTYLDIL